MDTARRMEGAGIGAVRSVVLVEADGKGSKITVTKLTPPGYATGEDFQRKSMCAVIEAAAPK